MAACNSFTLMWRPLSSRQNSCKLAPVVRSKPPQFRFELSEWSSRTGAKPPKVRPSQVTMRSLNSLTCACKDSGMGSLISQPENFWRCTKCINSPVKALRKGMAVRKLRTTPKMAAIFRGVMCETTTSFPNSRRTLLSLSTGTLRKPCAKSKWKPMC